MSAMRTSTLLRVSRANVARSLSMPVQRSISNVAFARSTISNVNGRQLINNKNVLPSLQIVRGYAASSGLSSQEIQNRIFEVLKSFEKVDPSKISASAAFTTDLGLDSLDAVEVVMAIEEEFAIDIPDAEADNITSVQQAIDYISKTPSAH